MAFFSNRAGSRLLTVKYLLDFKCSNWNEKRFISEKIRLMRDCKLIFGRVTTPLAGYKKPGVHYEGILNY